MQRIKLLQKLGWKGSLSGISFLARGDVQLKQVSEMQICQYSYRDPVFIFFSGEVQLHITGLYRSPRAAYLSFMTSLK